MQWMGEAPDWVLDNLNKLEPYLKAHAEKTAREYFERARGDRQKLVRGPSWHSDFDSFRAEYDIDLTKAWMPEKTINVLAALFAKYVDYQAREYHRLLLNESHA